MWIIPNIIQLVLIVTWSVCSIMLIAMWLPLKWTYKFACNIWSPVLIFLAGGRVTVTGRENIDSSKNYIFLANHSSWMDIMVLFCATKRMIRFLAKKELGRIPFLGSVMRKQGMIFVDRGNVRSSALSVKETLSKLQGGVDLAVFPEGTRSKTGKLGVLKKGVFTMAVISEIDIIPVGIIGAFKVWPHNNFGFRPGKVTVNIGKPISISSYTDANIGELIERVKMDILTLSEQQASK